MTDRIFVPGLTDAEQGILDGLIEQLAAKQRRNILRASYYDGKRAIEQIGTVIPPQYQKLAIVLGWSAKAVDILARRCNLDRFVWPDGNVDDLGYREVWQSNRLGAEVSAAMKSSMVHGVSFLVNTRGDESIGEPRSLLHVKDALNATGIWNPRSRALDNLLSITERDDDGRPTSFALYLPNLTVIAEKDRLWSVVDRQEHPWGVPAEPMVYKYDPRVPFGSSRISRPVMSIHDQALRAVIRLEGHMDVYSFPQMWLLGADLSIFKNADGSQKAQWQMMLGRMMGIPDDDDAEHPQNARADIKQFSAQSPEPHLAHLNALAKMFARETSLPDTSLAITDVSNPTAADAYDASQYELIAEAEGATEDWTPALDRAFARALAIQNGMDEIPAAWDSIEAKFRSPRFLSKSQEADAGAKQLGSVEWLKDTEVGLELLGLDDQQIRRAMSERRRAEGRGVLETIRAAAERVAADADAG